MLCGMAAAHRNCVALELAVPEPTIEPERCECKKNGSRRSTGHFGSSRTIQTVEKRMARKAPVWRIALQWQGCDSALPLNCWQSQTTASCKRLKNRE
jgi:hypothetical protein